MTRREQREFSSWWLLVGILVVVTSIVFTVMGYFGILGRTVVEREVFEQSYQRQAGLEEQIATYKAQLAEIEVQLADQAIDEATKGNLKAQQAAIKVQLEAVESAVR